MSDTKYPGKTQTPSGKEGFPAAWSRAVGIKPFRSTLSAIGWPTNQVTESKRGNFDFSVNQTGRKGAPIVRQFLLLFGEDDEASPPTVESDFMSKELQLCRMKQIRNVEIHSFNNSLLSVDRLTTFSSTQNSWRR